MNTSNIIKRPTKWSLLYGQPTWVRGQVICSALLAAALAGCGMDDQTAQGTDTVTEDTTSSQAVPAGQTRIEDFSLDAVATNPSAISHIAADEGFSVSGEINFQQNEAGMQISGQLVGLSPGEHGFHIHEFGDCSAPDGKSAGGHFNPFDNPHGGPQADVEERHAGDLGNIYADENGLATIDILNSELQISEGPAAISGKSVIVHAGSDDFTSQPSGDAGARAGCGVIEQTPQSS